MISIEQIIGDLLLRNNCVIVPGFGGFVANQVSAKIDYANGIMLPPKKSVLFNRQLMNNDGLLIKEFSTANEIDYSTAEKAIKDTVSAWNISLANGERITLDRVGFIFLDAEKNICFEQDRFFNLLLSSYGLGKVHFIADQEVKYVQHIQHEHPITTRPEEPLFKLESNQIDVVPAQIEEHAPVEIIHPATQRKISLWKYAAAIVMLPLAFYTYWIPMKTNVLESGVLSFKDFNPTYKSTEGKYKPVAFTSPKSTTQQDPSLDASLAQINSGTTSYSFKFSDAIYLNVKLANHQAKVDAGEEIIDDIIKKPRPHVEQPKVAVQSTKQSVKSVTAPITSSKPLAKGTYDLVVGCFGSTENANNLVKTLKAKGFNAKIVDKNGDLFRVSAGTTTSREAIDAVATNVKSLGLSGWVLKK